MVVLGLELVLEEQVVVVELEAVQVVVLEVALEEVQGVELVEE